MIGLGLLPTFYAVYTVAFAIYLHFVQGFATVSSLFIPCFVFAWYFLPLSGYASMKAYEVGGDIIRSLPPLFVCMFYGKAFSEPLRQLRNELQVMIHVIIEEFGPQLQGTSKEEFEKSRIIKSSTNSNTSGAASLSSFGASEEGGRPRSSSSSSTKPSASSFLFGEGFFDWDFVTDADDDIRSFLNDH